MATVLVVDDCERGRRYLATLLQHAGYQVTEAEDGMDGLERLRIDAPDLVIADIVMPSMDGFEFIRQMRERPETRNTRVILYTAAYDQEATLALARNSTATTIIAKPAEPDFLIRCVKRDLAEPSGESAALGDRFRSAHLELLTTQLHRKMAELERTNAQLLESNKALEKSNDALRQFAYAAGHDLQEPLRNLVNLAEMLAPQYIDRTNEQNAACLMECAAEARRIHAMITDLLAYTTVVEDSVVTQSLIDSNEVMREVIKNLGVAIAESGADVRCGRLPLVCIERTLLCQLLQNLVGNALKYRRKSGVPSVQISATGDSDFWTFQVQDNGIGFNPEYNDRIFKMFKRLHTRDEYPGTGIGLAICARIVAHHRGQIWAEGRPGEGAVFFFTLPAVSQVKEVT